MLKVYRINPATLEITYDKNVSIAFDASDSAFKSAIRSFDMYSPYTVTVTSAVSGSARTWTAEIYHLRTDAHEAEEF